MRISYTEDPYVRDYKDAGVNTGPKTKTEQEYIPLAVQIKRMIAAGELHDLHKHMLFEIGWDEDFNMNNINGQHRLLNLDRIDALEELNEANAIIEEANTAAESAASETVIEESGGTDIPPETEPVQPE